jgi:3-methyladenine DNA glycosylase AlkD
MNRIEANIQSRLFGLQDLNYRSFQCKLIPTVAPENVIGVRTPELRKIAKELSGTAEANEFLKILPHKYYEENNLHGFLIDLMTDYDQVVDLLDKFLPYVDNWATCDMMCPKVFKKHLPSELLEKIREWLKSSHTYTIRFAIEMLMTFYLGDLFLPEYPEMVAAVRSEEYILSKYRRSIYIPPKLSLFS